jgi:hypothetical protein
MNEPSMGQPLQSGNTVQPKSRINQPTTAAGRWPLPTRQGLPRSDLILRSSRCLGCQAVRTLSSSAVPLPCIHSSPGRSRTDNPRTTSNRPRPAPFSTSAGDDPTRTGIASRGSIGRGLHQPGPRWGRDRAVNDRNAADNHGQPQPSSVQLSSPPRPSTAGHGHQPIRSDTEEVTDIA